MKNYVHKERNLPNFTDLQHKTGPGTAQWAQSLMVRLLMTVPQLVLTGIQRQTQCEKPSKDTKQNTNTHCEPYFFSPIKATEDW